MALPTSGPLSINDIRVELGASSTNQSLGAFSDTAGFTAPDAISDFYGFSVSNFPADMVNSFDAIMGGNSIWLGYANTSNLNLSKYNTELNTSLTVPFNIKVQYATFPNSSSLSVTTDDKTDFNTITNLGWSNADGDKMFLVLRGTSTAITTWSTMTLTVDVSKVATINQNYNPGNEAFLWLQANLDPNGDPTRDYDQEPDGIFSGMTVTGPGLTGVVTTGDAVFLPTFGAWRVAINQTVTVTSGIKYTFAKTGYVSTFNRTNATLTTYNNARDGLNNPTDFLLYEWTTASGDGSPILGNSANVEVNFTS